MSTTALRSKPSGVPIRSPSPSASPPPCPANAHHLERARWRGNAKLAKRDARPPGTQLTLDEKAPMIRREFIASALAAIATAPAFAAPKPGARRPNIIFILADDMGFGDTSIYGQRK